MKKHLKVRAEADPTNPSLMTLTVLEQSHIGSQFGDIRNMNTEPHSFEHGPVRLTSFNPSVSYSTFKGEVHGAGVRFSIYLLSRKRDKQGSKFAIMPSKLWPEIRKAIRILQQI